MPVRLEVSDAHGCHGERVTQLLYCVNPLTSDLVRQLDGTVSTVLPSYKMSGNHLYPKQLGLQETLGDTRIPSLLALIFSPLTITQTSPKSTSAVLPVCVPGYHRGSCWLDDLGF